jgi:WD40 repeat protein
MKNILFALCFFTAFITVVITGCTSTRNDELARQRAAKLKEQREIARVKEEAKRRKEEQKRLAEEEAKKAMQEKPQGQEKPEYLIKKDSIKVSSSGVTAIALSPDGSLLACGTADGKLKVFEVGGGIKMAAKEHTGSVKSLLFSPDSSKLYSGAADESLIIWDPNESKPKKKVRGFFRYMGGLCIAPDGTTMAAGDGKRVYILDMDGHIAKKLESAAHGIQSLLFTADGEGVVSGSDRRLVEVWDISSSSIKHSLKRHSETVTCLAIDPDGKELVSGGADKMLVSWNIKKGERIRVYYGHRAPVTDTVYLHGGKYILSSDTNGLLIVWNRLSAKVFLKIQAHEKSIEDIVLSSDRKLLYTASSDGTVNIWEIKLEK